MRGRGSAAGHRSPGRRRRRSRRGAWWPRARVRCGSWQNLRWLEAQTHEREGSFMQRREFLKLSAAVAGSGMLSRVMGQTTQTQAVTLSAGPHLFLDDYLIDSQRNVTRVMQSPKRLAEPVITGRE